MKAFKARKPAKINCVPLKLSKTFRRDTRFNIRDLSSTLLWFITPSPILLSTKSMLRQSAAYLALVSS